VRELRNVLAYAFAIGEGPILQVADLPAEISSPLASGADTYVHTTEEPSDEDPELRRIRDALTRTSGNRDRAARFARDVAGHAVATDAHIRPRSMPFQYISGSA
jgi:DNA-binding NtrC family response regulator